MHIKTIAPKLLAILASKRRYAQALLLAVLMSFGVVGTAQAAQSSSSHYSVNEVQFGAGSSLHECSTNYCAKTSAGDLVVGNTKSANYAAWAGFNTTDQPLLEVMTGSDTTNMGVLDVGNTGTATATVKVRCYLSNGYVLQVTGPSPTQGVHHLDTPTTPTTSQQGIEQFGINLAANTTPAIGADPAQVPDSTFSFGTVTSNYNQANKFMYQDSDIVAQSLTSTGETDYTMSFIINVAPVTPAGRYVGNFSAVVVPLY